MTQWASSVMYCDSYKEKKKLKWKRNTTGSYHKHKKFLWYGVKGKQQWYNIADKKMEKLNMYNNNNVRIYWTMHGNGNFIGKVRKNNGNKCQNVHPIFPSFCFSLSLSLSFALCKMKDFYCYYSYNDKKNNNNNNNNKSINVDVNV